jgi:hypothetical protein
MGKSFSCVLYVQITRLILKPLPKASFSNQMCIKAQLFLEDKTATALLKQGEGQEFIA